MKTLVLLQNAWARDRREAEMFRQNRRVWLYATAISRSGSRLKRILGDECWTDDDIWFDNTTPRIGLCSSSKLNPDYKHVNRALDTFEPHVVLACGLQASEVAVKLWKGPIVCMPHPASRLLTNALCDVAGVKIRDENCGRIILKQFKGRIEIDGVEDGAEISFNERLIAS